MLQWMGGSRRKVTTSRKSAQNRQKQYFEQRKRRQQQTSGLENFHDAVDTGREHHKQHRSLDILSLLNLSAIPHENQTACTSGANTSSVQSHFMKNQAPALHPMGVSEESSEFVDTQCNNETGAPSCYEGDSSSPMKNKHNDYDSHNSTNKGVDPKSDQGKTSVEQNLSIFDLLGDDGMIDSSMASPIQEAHVAFSVDGLGKVEMETPACSPQHTGRSFSYGFSPHPKTTQPWNFSQKINMLDDLEFDMDMMMQNNKPHDASSFKYSIEMMDTCESPKKKSPAKTSFQCVEDCNRNTYYGGKNIFDGMDTGRDRWDGGFGFLDDNDFLGEMEHNFFEKNYPNRIDNDSTDFLKYGKCDISENAFDSPYLPKKRGASRTMDEFNLFAIPSFSSESAKSNLKHHTSGYDYDLKFDTERSSRTTRISEFEDKPPQPNWFCSVADNATENFSLLSEESCSSSAVRGEAYNSTQLNTNLRQSLRRGRDGNSGPENSYTVDSIYSRDSHCKFRDKVNQRDHALGTGKCVQKSNSSKSKPVYHSNPPFMEKLGPSKNWLFEKESNLSSFCQNPETDLPFRGFMPCTGDPFPGPSFPESSFTNKYGETVAHPPSNLISKRFSVQPSKTDSVVIEQDLHPNSKLVGIYPDVAEATSSHGGNTISPVTSAQESIDEEEKSESKFPPSGSEKVGFQEEICIGSKEVHTDDREWLDTSNYENINGDSARSSVQNEPPAMENLEASSFSAHVKIPDENRGADENKYNHNDKVSVPCTKGEKEVNDFRVQGRKTGNKNCSVDSSSQVMMLESYVLQLLFVQKVLKQASAQDYMKNA